MKRFDKRLKRQLRQEAPKISVKAEEIFDETINKIQKQNLKRKPQLMQSLAAFMAISMIVVVLLLLNFKTGHLDKGRNQMTKPDICSEVSIEEDRKAAEQPQIEEMESIRVGMMDYHNPEIRQFIEIILTQFKNERKDSQKNLDIDYEIITNTEQWFVLRVIAWEEKGNKIYYYNVNKKSCQIVQLSDLFVAGFDYAEVFHEELMAQIKEEMSQETDKGDYYKINRNQEFYFNQKGNLVLVFEKGETAQEEKGTIWFVIEREVFEKALN